MIHTLHLPGFAFATVNQLLGHWSKAARLKRVDREVTAYYARQQEIPLATGRRRVSLRISKPGRHCDPDASWKSALDSCVACGLLLDDCDRWCSLGGVELVKGERSTWVILEDCD